MKDISLTLGLLVLSFQIHGGVTIFLEIIAGTWWEVKNDPTVFKISLDVWIKNADAALTMWFTQRLHVHRSTDNPLGTQGCLHLDEWATSLLRAGGSWQQKFVQVLLTSQRRRVRDIPYQHSTLKRTSGRAPQLGSHWRTRESSHSLMVFQKTTRLKHLNQPQRKTLQGNMMCSLINWHAHGLLSMIWTTDGGLSFEQNKPCL